MSWNKNAIKIDARRFIKTINEGAHARIASFERALRDLGAKSGKDLSLTTIHKNSMIFEDRKTNTHYMCDVQRHKGNRFAIRNIKRLDIHDDEKRGVLRKLCESLIDSIETDDSKKINNEFSKLRSARFTNKVIPNTKHIRSKDGRVHRLNESKILNTGALAKQIAESFGVVNKRSDGAIVISESKTRLPFTISELCLNKARGFAADARMAYKKGGFNKRILKYHKLIAEGKHDEAVRAAKNFTTEFQEFTMLSKNDCHRLIGNSLATNLVFSEEAAKNVADMFWHTAVAFNRKDILKTLAESAKIGGNNDLLSKVRNLAKIKKVSALCEAYDKFVTDVISEGSMRDVRIDAIDLKVDTILGMLRSLGDAADPEVVSQLEDMRAKLSSGGADDTLYEAERLLASLSDEMLQGINTLDSFADDPDIELEGDEEEAPIGGEDDEEDTELVELPGDDEGGDDLGGDLGGDLDMGGDEGGDDDLFGDLDMGGDDDEGGLDLGGLPESIRSEARRILNENNSTSKKYKKLLKEYVDMAPSFGGMGSAAMPPEMAHGMSGPKQDKSAIISTLADYIEKCRELNINGADCTALLQAFTNFENEANRILCGEECPEDDMGSYGDMAGGIEDQSDEYDDFDDDLDSGFDAEDSDTSGESEFESDVESDISDEDEDSDDSEFGFDDSDDDSDVDMDMSDDSDESDSDFSFGSDDDSDDDSDDSDDSDDDDSDDDDNLEESFDKGQANVSTIKPMGAVLSADDEEEDEDEEGEDAQESQFKFGTKRRSTHGYERNQMRDVEESKAEACPECGSHKIIISESDRSMAQCADCGTIGERKHFISAWLNEGFVDPDSTQYNGTEKEARGFDHPKVDEIDPNNPGKMNKEPVGGAIDPKNTKYASDGDTNSPGVEPGQHPYGASGDGTTDPTSNKYQKDSDHRNNPRPKVTEFHRM